MKSSAERENEVSVCDECGKDYDHKGHCDICGRGILSNFRQHDAVFGHVRMTDAEAEDQFESRFEHGAG